MDFQNSVDGAFRTLNDRLSKAKGIRFPVYKKIKAAFAEENIEFRGK